jgi:hypothetical protein
MPTTGYARRDLFVWMEKYPWVADRSWTGSKEDPGNVLVPGVLCTLNELPVSGSAIRA